MSSALPPTLKTQFGGYLISTFVCCFLWGLSTLQTFIYYMSGKTDRGIIKWLPATLWVLDALHQLLLCVGMYQYLVQHFGDPNIIVEVVPELETSLIFQGLICILAQGFFAWRILRFSKSWIVPIIAAPIAVAQLIATLYYVGRRLGSAAFSAILEFAWTIPATYSINVFLDFCLSLGMIYYLYRQRPDVHSSNAVIHRIIAITINTGLTTAIFSLVTISLYAANSESTIFGAIGFLLGPLYCNCVLANLNARSYIREPLNHSNTFNLPASDTPLDTLRFKANPRAGVTSSTNYTSTDVRTTKAGPGDSTTFGPVESFGGLDPHDDDAFNKTEV